MAVIWSNVWSLACAAGESGCATPMTAAGKRGAMPTRPTCSTMSSSRLSASSVGVTVTSSVLPSRSTPSVTGLPALLRDDLLDLGEARDLVAVDARDAVARIELAVRRLAGDDLAHGRGQELLDLEEDRRVERDREEEVHRRPREDDDDPLPERLRLEGAVPVLGQDRLALLALLEHLHEAAEGQEAHAVLGLLAADAQDLRPEADREGEHLHAEDLREGEVPRLVDEDEGADEDDEVQKVHGQPRLLG